VLIAIAEDSGAVDVQQYLLPVASAELRDGEQLGARELRRLELAQRYYVHRPSLEGLPRQRGAVESEADFDELLHGKWHDPLMGALAGYTLIHRGATDRYAGAMENMLEYFAGLPDSHVLAGLATPKRRDEHFARALELGVPMFAQGFRALYRWHQERQADDEWPMLLEPSALLPASPWTAWIAERPVLLIRDGTFGRPPVGWPMLHDRREDIEAALRAVGRLSGAEGNFTAFAVARGLILAMRSTVSADGVQGMTVDFGDDPTATPHPFAVTGVERVIKGSGGQPIALLRTEDVASDGTPFPKPLRLAGAPPSSLERRRVYVAGFPTADLNRARELGVEAAFAEGGAAKRLQPGQVLGLDGDGTTLRHDCLTLRGNGGSPVVDLATGVVLGIHYSTMWSQYKRGNAVPAWDVADLLA
jgi:hypothetical protein